MVLQFGIVGVAGRGGSFTTAIRAHDDATLQAICDVDEDALERTRSDLGVPEAYTAYETMLADSDLDAVVVATPMFLHAAMSIAALDRGIHVLSEVPAAVSVAECRDLVAAVADSAGTYAMAENYVYQRPNALVRELIEQGWFGDPYYFEGEYLHELKTRNEETPWRREWQTGIDGITYPTHSLCPILQWIPDDQVARVTCAGSGHHYSDPRGDAYEQQDTTVMLCETAAERLIKIRLDMVSERPHAMDNYQVQGTRGAYESARAPGEANRVWLERFEDAEDSRAYEWRDLETYTEYLPEYWQDPDESVSESGHGGGDYLVTTAFIETALEGGDHEIGIHEAMDATLPGLVSQDIVGTDEWRDVPNSRDWL